MDLMKKVSKQHLDSSVVVFINDILYYSYSEQENATHLRVVLQTLKDRQSFVKSRKCEFICHFPWSCDIQGRDPS